MSVSSSVKVLLVSSVVLFGACTKMPRQVKYIPKNTASVITIDRNSMFEKSETKGERATKKVLAYLASYGFSNETFDFSVETVFAPTDLTGVASESEIMAYLIPSTEFRNAYRCMSIMLSDSAQFSTFLHKHLGENYVRLEGTNKCVCYVNNDRYSWVAYNDEMALFGSAMLHTKGIVECINDIFTTTDGSLAINTDFRSFYKKRNDVSVWMATDKCIETYLLWYSDIPALFNSIAMPEYVHVDASFDTDLNVSFSCVPKASFKRYWKKNNFMRKQFDSSFCSVLPSNSLWFVSMAVEPSLLSKQFSNTSFYEYIEKELSKLNLQVSDFVNSFSGEVAFSMYDVSLEPIRTFAFQKTVSVVNTMVWKHFQKDEKSTFPHIALAFSLKDSKIPVFVLNHISQDACAQVIPGVYDFSKLMGFPLKVVCRDEAMIVTTDDAYARQLVENKEIQSDSENMVSSLVNNVQGNVSYHYIDFTIKNYPETVHKYLHQLGADSLVYSYSNIVKSAEMRVSDSYSGTINVSFQDTTKNSLLQLNDLLEIVLP